MTVGSDWGAYNAHERNNAHLRPIPMINFGK